MTTARDHTLISCTLERCALRYSGLQRYFIGENHPTGLFKRTFNPTDVVQWRDGKLVSMVPMVCLSA